MQEGHYKLMPTVYASVEKHTSYYLMFIYNYHHERVLHLLPLFICLKMQIVKYSSISSSVVLYFICVTLWSQIDYIIKLSILRAQETD